LQSVQFTISGEHNEILNIVNQNQTDQKIIFDIKVSNNIYNSPLYKINCFVDPSKCQQPVTSEEQNPNYTAADNAELLIKLTDYLEHHLPTFAIYNLQQICDNVYLTEEEKYHKIQEELLKQDVKLVDHVVLEEEIKEIEQSQDVKIQNLTGLDQHQKDQLVNDVHDLFDEYHHQAVDDVLLMSDLYDNTINFVETTDKIPQEQKIQIDADLLLEAFFENNTPVVSKTAAPFDEIIEKISNEFTTANTSLLGLVLTTKNGEPFDQNVVSNKFVLLSKITSSDITTFTINIQYTLGQINQDESLTIYEGEEPLECSYVLQPSLKLDQQQMSA
jgi:hypothetical protein